MKCPICGVGQTVRAVAVESLTLKHYDVPLCERCYAAHRFLAMIRSHDGTALGSVNRSAHEALRHKFYEKALVYIDKVEKEEEVETVPVLDWAKKNW